MRRQLVSGLFLTVVATTASAGESIAPSRAAESASGETALAALPPVMTTAEGATDAAGGASHILSGALYGGLAGAVIGAGVGLIEGGNYGRDIGVGAGAGILIGGALGAANVFGDARPLPATDGLGSTDRDPVVQARTVGLAGRF